MSAPPDHLPECLVQARLDLGPRPIDAVVQGDGEGARGQGPEEALPPGLALARGGGLPLPGPAPDRLRQRPPESQFHLEPRVLQPSPEYEEVGGTGELGREVLDPDVSISRCALLVAHE